MREFIHINLFSRTVFFIAEKTKTWRCEVPLASSHSQEEAELRFKPKWSASRVDGFNLYFSLKISLTFFSFILSFPASHLTLLQVQELTDSPQQSKVLK